MFVGFVTNMRYICIYPLFVAIYQYICCELIPISYFISISLEVDC